MAGSETEAGAFEFESVLEGEHLRLRPIREDDFVALYAVASDPLVWEQHPARERWKREVFEQWMQGALAQHALVVEDRATNRVIGSSRYYHWDSAMKEVSIGYTFLSREYWGGATNRELKMLMLDHAFHWAERVWFHVNPGNTRSRKAMAKIGGRETHVGPLSINGEAEVEYVFFAIDRAR